MARESTRAMIGDRDQDIFQMKLGDSHPDPLRAKIACLTTRPAADKRLRGVSVGDRDSPLITVRLDAAGTTSLRAALQGVGVGP